MASLWCWEWCSRTDGTLDYNESIFLGVEEYHETYLFSTSASVVMDQANNSPLTKKHILIFPTSKRSKRKK